MNPISLKDLNHIQSKIINDFGYRTQTHKRVEDINDCIEWVYVTTESKNFTGIGVYPSDDYDTKTAFIYSNYCTNSPNSCYRSLVNFETNGLYFYNNLDYKINTSWHDELHNNYVKTPHSPTCVMIYGEYKFIPIKMFNNIDSLIKIGMYHWNRLNKQYLKLKTGLTDKNKEFVEHIKLKNKCKIVNKRMNDFKRDFL